MLQTLRWYRRNEGAIRPRLPLLRNRCPSGVEFAFVGNNHPIVDLPFVHGVLERFPATARQRMALKHVSVEPPLWFAHDALPNAPKVTVDPEEYMSLTAIVPSYVDYAQSKVSVYDISLQAASARIQRIIYAEALAHEFAHLVVVNELYGNNGFKLRFPNGTTVDSFEWLLSFGELVDRSGGPISHYLSAYCDAEGKLLRGDNRLTPINEAMAECVAAYLFGFAYHPNDRGLTPFEGKADLKKAVKDYLNATRVK